MCLTDMLVIFSFWIRWTGRQDTK